MMDVRFVRPNEILKEIIFPKLEELRIISQFSFRDGKAEFEIRQFIIHHLNILKKIEIRTSEECPYSYNEHYYSNFVKKIPQLMIKNDCMNFTKLYLQIDEKCLSIVVEIIKKSKNLKELELEKFFDQPEFLDEQYLKDIFNEV